MQPSVQALIWKWSQVSADGLSLRGWELWRGLPFAKFWSLWRERNLWIFKDQSILEDVPSRNIDSFILGVVYLLFQYALSLVGI